MTFSFGPVPPWNAPPNEKIAYGVTLAAIILFFSRARLPGRPISIRHAPGRRPASVREIVLFIGMTIALSGATVGWHYLWNFLKELRYR
jgi:hypothetical protein